MDLLHDVNRELWLRGELDWLLHAGQMRLEEAFAKAGKLFVTEDSRQLGKTVWAAKKCIEVGIKYPGSQIRFATAFETDLRELVLPAFEFILSTCPEDIRPPFREAKSSWTLWTGSRIKLVGMDRKPQGLRGNKLALVIYDEAGFMSRLKQTYQNVVIPTMTHVPHGRVVMMSSSPEDPDHEFCEFADEAAENGSYLKLTILDNPLLTQKDHDRIAKDMGGRESDAYQREYMCVRLVDPTRAIVPDFEEARHVVESPVPAPRAWYHNYEGLDSGVQHLTGGLLAYYDFLRAKVVIEDEFTLRGAEVTTRRISECFRDLEVKHGWITRGGKNQKGDYLYSDDKVYRRISDNNNLILLQDMASEFGLYFDPTSKDELPAMVNKVRNWFKSNRIEVNPRCQLLIGCLKAAIWNEKRDKFAESRLHGHFDLLAALMYLIRNVDEHTNPIPASWQIDFSNQILFQNRRNGVSEAGQTLAAAFGGR